MPHWLYLLKRTSPRNRKRQGKAVIMTVLVFLVCFTGVFLFNLCFSANRDKHLNDDNDEIVLIPDLDEDGGADSDQRSKCAV